MSMMYLALREVWRQLRTSACRVYSHIESVQYDHSAEHFGTQGVLIKLGRRYKEERTGREDRMKLGLRKHNGTEWVSADMDVEQD